MQAMLATSKKELGDRLSISGSLIMGLPFDTEADARRSVDWSMNSGVISSCSIYRLTFFDKQHDLAGMGETDGISKIARDPAKYGYSRLPSSSVPEAYANKVMPNEVLWVSNTGMTVYDAIDLAAELGENRASATHWGGCNIYERSAANGLGIPAISRPDLVVDYKTIETLFTRKAARYVRNKLAWNDITG
jgi:hypothetical protein